MNSKYELKTADNDNKFNIFEFAEFSFDLNERILLRHNEIIPLPPKTCELLSVLLINHGKLVTKEELFTQVWADTFVEEANLTHHIAVLRKALGENKDGRKFIETVTRRGYRFIEPIIETSGNQLMEGFATERTTTRIIQRIELINDDSEPPIEARKSLTVSPKPIVSRNYYGFILVLLLVALASTIGSFVFYKSFFEKKQIPSSQPELTRVSDKNISISVISPDGKFIAYAQNSNVKHSGGSLSIRQLDSNQEIQLVEPDDSRIFADMKFSPDGSLIYFISYEKNAKVGAIYRIPFLGGTKQKFVDLGEGNHSFAIAPDGKQIAFYRFASDGENCSLVSIPVDSPAETEKVLFTFKFSENNFGGFLSWSPDGKYIGMTKYSNPPSPGVKIFGFDLETKEIKQFSEEVFENIGKHIFSPDGKEILFVGKREKTPQNFFAVNILDGSLRPLSLETSDANFYSNYGLSITADGKTMTADLTDSRADIWNIGINDGKAVKEERIKRGTSDGKRGLTLLPDGKILFTAISNGKSDIWKMNSDGTIAQPLTNDAFIERNLIATKDGRFVIFSSNAVGGWHLFRRNTNDGSDLKQLTFGEAFDIQPDISADGQWIVYISEENGRSVIKKIPFEGGSPIVLNDKENSVYPKFSPDGTKIAFHILSTSRSQPGSIALISSNGGKIEKNYLVTEFQHRNDAITIQWTSDGRGIVFLKQVTSLPNLWQLDLKTETVSKIWTSLPDESIYNLALSANGSQLFISQGVYQTNTVLIRNFDNNEIVVK